MLMTPKSTFASLQLVASFLALAFFCVPESGASSPPKSDQPSDIRFVHLSRGEITRFVTLPGEIKPYQVAVIYAKVAGYLKTITVDKGDAVTEGALLAEIEAPELVADRAKFKAEVELAELDYKRLSDAQKKAPDLVVPLSVDSAKSKSEVAKANLDRAEILLRFARITAPFSGIVTRRIVDPGAFIPAATSGSTPQNAALLTLMDFQTVRVQVAVPEAESSLVSTGQPVKVLIEGLPNRAFTGQVSRLSYALDESTKTMLVEADLPNQKLELRPGMYATVKIGIEKKETAQLLPAEALLMEKANGFVFTVKDNKAQKVPVKIGFNDGARVEILGGLTVNDTVIIPGKRPLSDGQPVRVIESN